MYHYGCARRETNGRLAPFVTDCYAPIVTVGYCFFPSSRLRCSPPFRVFRLVRSSHLWPGQSVSIRVHPWLHLIPSAGPSSPLPAFAVQPPFVSFAYFVVLPSGPANPCPFVSIRGSM